MTRIPGAHAPNIKNRSSKHLICLTKRRPVVRSWSNEQLAKAGSGDPDITKERNRRAEKRSRAK